MGEMKLEKGRGEKGRFWTGRKSEEGSNSSLRKVVGENILRKNKPNQRKKETGGEKTLRELRGSREGSETHDRMFIYNLKQLDQRPGRRRREISKRKERNTLRPLKWKWRPMASRMGRKSEGEGRESEKRLSLQFRQT